MRKTVLVLGGSYFIGKSIVDALLQNGYGVSTLNRGSKPADSRVTPIICDRNDADAMRDALGGLQFDMIVDVSGLNRKQVEIVCSSIKIDRLQKYLFISSSAVYAVDELSSPYKETDTLGKNHLWTSYGTGKIEAEDYLQETFSGTDTELIFLRPPYIYGENNYVYRESFVFDHLHSGRPLIVPGDGEAKLQFISADDLAQTVITLLSGESKGGTQIYNVGNREAVSINEWVALCEKAASKEVTKIHFDYRSHGFSERDFFPFFDYDNILETSRIRVLNIPEKPMLDGLKKAYKWYLENCDTIARKTTITENEDKIYKLLNL